MSKKTKQFIAGAQCPQCHKLDTIVLIREGKQKSFHCIACKFKQQEKQDMAISIIEVNDKP